MNIFTKYAWIFLGVASGWAAPALSLSSSNANSCSAQSFIDTPAPKCPSSGRLLPETYPVESFSISDDTEGYLFVEQMVVKVFRAQPNPPPIIFLNVKSENFAKLQNHLRSMSWATPQMVQNLRWAHSTGVDEFGDVVDATLNWQQDFYKGSFDSRTGLATARMLTNYPEIGKLAKTFPEDLKACGISVGPELPAREISHVDKVGFRGGNIDVIPSGICVVGDADLTDEEWDAYSKDVCGPIARVKAPTSWLESLHTDEIFRVVPTSDPAPCNFALLFASPDKALKVLSDHGEEPAFSYGSMSGVDFNYEQARYPGMSTLCGVLESDQYNRGRGLLKPNFQLNESFMHIAGAPIAPGVGCYQAKNSDLVRAIRLDPTVAALNVLVQKNMDDFKRDVDAHLRQTLPQCRIKTLDVPNLFVGDLGVKPDGQKVLLSGSAGKSGYSVFPNPTNADVIGKTVIMPEPYNPAIKQDLITQLSHLGLKPDFIDTLKGFKVFGNVHCETQMLRYCRP